MLAPSPASFLAIANPIPRLAPEITALLFSNRRIAKYPLRLCDQKNAAKTQLKY